MPKKYIKDRIEYLLDAITSEEAHYDEAKEFGTENCYGAAFSLGALDRLRQELYSHEKYLYFLKKEDMPKKRKSNG